MLINVTVPVYNEEKILPSTVETLHSFLSSHCRFDWEIVIANNASIDRTQVVACLCEMAARFPGVSVCCN